MENQMCSICREAGCNIITACEHYYHYHCLNRWLSIRPTCPMCREVIPSHGNLDNGDISSADYENSSERAVDMSFEDSLDANLRILNSVVRLDISPLANVNDDNNNDDNELLGASELVDVAVEAAVDIAAEVAYDVALEVVSDVAENVENSQEVNISRSVAIGVDNESGNMLIEVEEIEVDNNNYGNLLEEMNRLREQNSNLRDELYELREDRIEELRQENDNLRDDISEVRDLSLIHI